MDRLSRRSTALVLLFGLLGHLMGCAPSIVESGLAPTIDATDLAASTTNYLEVERLLVRRAGFLAPPPVGEGRWYPIVVAGYSYVDEKCNAFMDQLFAEDRRLQAIRNQLNDISNVTTTILTATSAARADIGIVAAAFGLASNTVDNYQIIRLVDLGPAKVQKLVTKAQQAYRANTLANWRLFANRVFAQQAIAGYLDVCRVPTIVANIDKAIEVADFVADAASGDPLLPRLLVVGGNEASTNTVRKRVGLSPLSPTKLHSPYFQAQQRPPIKPTAPLRPTPQLDEMAVPRGAENMTERSLSISKLKKLQRRLCVVADGVFGPETRHSIKEYQGFTRSPKDGRLRDASVVEIEKDDECPRGLKNYMEKILMRTPGGIRRVKEALNTISAGGVLKVDNTIDEQFRRKVKAVREHKLLPRSINNNDDVTFELAEKLGIVR